MKLKKTVATLSALAQETRLKIFRELVKSHSPDQNLGGLPPGVLTKKLNVSAHRFSVKAQEQIEAAGGTVTVLPGKAPVIKNKMKPKTPKNRD